MWVFLAALGLTVVVALGLSAILSRPHVEPPGTIIGQGDRWRDEEDLNALLFPAPLQPFSETWEEILPALEEQAKDNPRDALSQRRLALAYYNLGRYEDARAVYKELLAEEETALISNRLGNVLRDEGDLTGAEEAYRRALVLDPALPSPYVNLAELLWRTRRDEEARAILAKGLEKVPEEARPHLERALKLIEAGSSTAPAS